MILVCARRTRKSAQITCATQSSIWYECIDDRETNAAEIADKYAHQYMEIVHACLYACGSMLTIVIELNCSVELCVL